MYSIFYSQDWPNMTKRRLIFEFMRQTIISEKKMKNKDLHVYVPFFF